MQTTTRPRCDQCQEVRINGTVCHEIGCPNIGRAYDHDREAWIRYVDCTYCGDEVEEGEACTCAHYWPEEDDEEEASR